MDGKKAIEAIGRNALYFEKAEQIRQEGITQVQAMAEWRELVPEEDVPDEAPETKLGECTMKPHVTCGQDEETELYHGLYFINSPTPSGCSRPSLKFSTKQGYKTPRLAIECMKEILESDLSAEEFAEVEFPSEEKLLEFERE